MEKERLATAKANAEKEAEANRRDERDRLEAAFAALEDLERQELIDTTLTDYSDSDYLVRDYRKKGMDSVLFRQAVIARFAKQKN